MRVKYRKRNRDKKTVGQANKDREKKSKSEQQGTLGQTENHS